MFWGEQLAKYNVFFWNKCITIKVQWQSNGSVASFDSVKTMPSLPLVASEESLSGLIQLWWRKVGLISGMCPSYLLIFRSSLGHLFRHGWKPSRHPPSPTSVTVPFLPASQWLGPSGSPSPPLNLHWVGGLWPTWRKRRRPWTAAWRRAWTVRFWASPGVWARGPPYHCPASSVAWKIQTTAEAH